eukprot:295618-Pelagomonas_calceolata.AAC.4
MPQSLGKGCTWRAICWSDGHASPPVYYALLARIFASWSWTDERMGRICGKSLDDERRVD